MALNKGVVGTFVRRCQHPGVFLVLPEMTRLICAKRVSLAFLLGERNMADSNITKLALSGALKELLEEQSFEKISVSDICERCGMNRKSFYYHFKDKYDLVNWIFDTEFVEVNQFHDLYMGDGSHSFDDRWKNIEITCNYFYEITAVNWL